MSGSMSKMLFMHHKCFEHIDKSRIENPCGAIKSLPGKTFIVCRVNKRRYEAAHSYINDHGLRSRTSYIDMVDALLGPLI